MESQVAIHVMKSRNEGTIAIWRLGMDIVATVKYKKSSMAPHWYAQTKLGDVMDWFVIIISLWTLISSCKSESIDAIDNESRNLLYPCTERRCFCFQD